MFRILRHGVGLTVGTLMDLFVSKASPCHTRPGGVRFLLGGVTFSRMLDDTRQTDNDEFNQGKRFT